ncbi:preprotein translocase subunit SecD [Natronolimnobius sp. AArcel1]|uniref:preprotein translocase subunit SecD n=1 Tax=Natronolimnobius sp. AArcel1 TaxID=1679093 RepID=UPI0013EABC5B|nr:preprotein translocase subunit SecD [Natronolimnobius sp. AArcel1]NGM69846.1 preprotein translocase subunit SecD [Natronolimnobius sp. AArcel1]
MGPKAFIKEYWRLILLILFVTAALVALFYPGGIMADDAVVEDEVDDTASNLEYGIDLDGGTRISAPITGLVAEDIDAGIVDEDGSVDHDRSSSLEDAIYEELDLETGDASVTITDDGTVSAEIYTDEVSEEEFAAVLQDQGVDVDEDDIRSGVSAQTRAQMIDTIQDRVNEAGLTGGTAYEEDTLGEGYYIVTEVPDMDPDELRELLEERGIVELQAYYQTDDGSYTNETVLTGEEIDTVDAPRSSEENPGYEVPISVDGSAAPGYQDRLNELGFTSEGQGQCDLSGVGGEVEFQGEYDRSQYCLVTVVDGEAIDAHSMGPRLADNMNAGTWQDDPSFFMGAPELDQAQLLSVNLRAGSMPAPLDFSQEQTLSVEPALADQFKLYSLLIGGLSILAVSGMVFLRYRNPKVAMPMILTATAEVVILLGFAALIRMPLDLSHVAGFIAVVGTGVDDLIIIADEVMDEGEVSSQRVFESRFRKAFWIIGAAAATTIIALSPLAVLSLGDLRGFAIITILGVLIGVLITRPAYGDILQRLLTDR